MIELAFREAMAADGLDPGVMPQADGIIHRFNVGSHRGRGWFILHPPEGKARACGLYGDWGDETGARKWLAGNAPVTRTDTIALRRLAEARRAALALEHSEGATRAATRWRAAPAATEGHPYLARKRIKPGPARQEGDLLLIPAYSTGGVGAPGTIQSLQTIAPDGRKIYTKGAAMAGACCPIGVTFRDADLVIIAEGFSTGMTISEAMPGACVVVAFHASNLVPVARWASRERPETDMIIAADNDRMQGQVNGKWRNVGMRYGCAARDAARAPMRTALLALAYPAFQPGEVGTDFNDLAALRGIDAVTQAIMGAINDERA